MAWVTITIHKIIWHHHNFAHNLWKGFMKRFAKMKCFCKHFSPSPLWIFLLLVPFLSISSVHSLCCHVYFKSYHVYLPLKVIPTSYFRYKSCNFNVFSVAYTARINVVILLGAWQWNVIMASVVCLDLLPKESFGAGDLIFYYSTIGITGKKKDEHCALILKIKMNNHFSFSGLDNNKYVLFDHSINIISRDAGDF